MLQKPTHFSELSSGELGTLRRQAGEPAAALWSALLARYQAEESAPPPSDWNWGRGGSGDLKPCRCRHGSEGVPGPTVVAWLCGSR